MVKDFWCSFQFFLGNSKLPQFLVEILKNCGYDSPISLELLDEEKIKEIEQFIEINFGCAHSLVRDTIYENKEQFKFLPGHLTLLLGLKIYANKFIDSGLRKSKIKSKELSRDLDTITEEVEVLSDQELNKLKSILVKKIVNFCRKINVDTEKLSDESVGQDIDTIIKTNGELVYKTTFACPICEVRIPCIHNQHWQVSNLERHIKTHQTRKLLPQVAGKLDQILNGETPKGT